MHMYVLIILRFEMPPTLTASKATLLFIIPIDGPVMQNKMLGWKQPRRK